MPGKPEFPATPSRSPSPTAGKGYAIPTLSEETTGFQESLQAMVDAGQVMELPGDVTLSEPVEIVIRHSHTGWFGLDGRYHKIFSSVRDAPALTFRMADDVTPVGTCARGFMLSNLTMIGSGDEEGGLRIDVPAPSSWLVNAELRSLWLEGFGGKAAVTCRGNVFESAWYNVGTQDNAGAGLYFQNAGGGAVVSAMHLFGGTQRQNGGAGFLVDQYDGPGDISLYGMYFCLNRGGGIHSWAGLELIDKCGFENNSEFGINVQNYCHMKRCTGSTMGTQPQLVIGYLANPWTVEDCTMTGYSGADPGFGTFTGNGQRLTLRGRYDMSRISVGSGVDVVCTP